MYLCKSLNRKRLAVSQDTIEMKDYKEILSTFDGEYYKNLLGDIHEKVERYNEIGQVCRVSLRWRGKYYHLQLFFPGSKFPSRKEVEVQVHKVYPDATVMVHYASESQPNQPLVRVAESKEDKELRKLASQERAAERKAEKDYRSKGRNVPEKKKGPKMSATPRPKRDGKDYADHILSSPSLKNMRKEERNPNTGLPDIKEVKSSNNNKGNVNDPDLRRLIPESEVLDEGEMIEGIMQMVKRAGKKPEPKKHDFGRDAGNIARKKLEKKERETYVNDMDNSFGEETKYYKGNPKGTPKKPKAGDRRPGVKEEKNYVEFMKRVEKLPEVTRDSIKELGDDPLVAKAALEISGLPK